MKHDFIHFNALRFSSNEVEFSTVFNLMWHPFYVVDVLQQKGSTAAKNAAPVKSFL